MSHVINKLLSFSVNNMIVRNVQLLNSLFHQCLYRPKAGKEMLD